MWTKGLVFGIIMLFVAINVTSSVSSTFAELKGELSEKSLVPLTEGLIGYWNFNEGSGSVAHDSSGNGYNGNIYGATWTTGKYGSALEIKDTSYVGDISPSYDDSITTALTVAAWIKWYGPSSYPHDCIIFDGRGNPGQGFIFRIDSWSANNKLLFWLNDDAGVQKCRSISLIPIGSWTHVAAVFDHSSNICHLYINGNLDNTSTITQAFSQSGYEPLIGNNHFLDGKWAPFNGIEDEIRIYNRALSDNEIKQLAGYFAFNMTGGLGVNLKILNNGITDATGVPWQIQVKGGILGRINKTVDGSIDIPAGGSKTVGTGMFFGFGAISITVKVVDEEKTAIGTQIIIFTILNK